MPCPDGSPHDWEPTEVALESDAADTTSTCTRCGTVGYLAGQGRQPRPALPDIVFTGADELPD